MDSSKKELFREAARAEALKKWRAEAKQGDAGAKLMADLYYGARKPLARGGAGEPPLIRETADAMLEMIYFMASKTADPSGGEVRPPKELLDRWAGELAAGYGALAASRKEEMAAMPGLWAALRMAWSEAPAEQRARLAAQWSQMAPVKQVAQQIKRTQPERDRAAKAERDASLDKATRDVNLHRDLVNMGALQWNYRGIW